MNNMISTWSMIMPKKWRVSIDVTAFKEVEAETLVEAGDKVTKWAENKYALWHWLSTYGNVEIASFIEEITEDKKEEDK